MQTKLTLRMDQELIRKAKKYAEETGTSVSKMVAEYFDHLSDFEAEEEDLPPVLKRLSGVLGRQEINEDEYYEYLEKKYR